MLMSQVITYILHIHVHFHIAKKKFKFKFNVKKCGKIIHQIWLGFEEEVMIIGLESAIITSLVKRSLVFLFVKEDRQLYTCQSEIIPITTDISFKE